MKNKLKKIAKLCIYLFVVTIVIVFGLEFSLRILGYPYNSPCILYDKDTYWRMASNQKLHFKDEMKENAVISINSLGARGEEFSIEKTPGEKRIICTGDSYTYGYGVDDKYTYSAQLQNFINNDFDDVNVINYGCNGYTILHEYGIIKKLGLRLKPDYVLIAISINTDFADIVNLDYNLGYMPAPGYNLIKQAVRRTAIGNVMLKTWNSKKVKKLLKRAKKLGSIRNKLNLVNLVYAEQKKEAPMDIYLDKLDQLVELGNQHNFKVIYVILPWNIANPDRAKISATYTGYKDININEYMSILMARYNQQIILIELMSSFNSQDLFLADGHLNRAGNKLAASVIYQNIKDYLK